MLLAQVALVSEIREISASELTSVAAALQKQVTRDFSPIWGVPGTVDAFTRLEDVPIGYWPIIVSKNIHDPGAAGVHLDKHGQPFSLVQYSQSWSLTVSHECLEMLVDPFGNRVIAGQSPKEDQGRVEFLVEACDPCEGSGYAYTSNGVLVSDFITPHFFDPVTSASVRYSFTGAIQSPRDVLSGGYLSWHDPITDHWWQVIFFGANKEFKDLGVMELKARSLRETIDKMTPRPELVQGLAADNKQLVATRAKQKAISQATKARAQAWRSMIKAPGPHLTEAPGPH
jgi:hypothetical protein